jgi:hypothetical protein
MIVSTVAWISFYKVVCMGKNQMLSNGRLLLRGKNEVVNLVSCMPFKCPSQVKRART